MPPADASDVDEDDVVIAAFRELSANYRDLLLILAPRKPERFDDVGDRSTRMPRTLVPWTFCESVMSESESP